MKFIFLFLGLVCSALCSATPSITQLNPAFGPSVGGNQVAISGNGFKNVTSVVFGNKQAASFTVANKDLIIAIAPEDVPGTVTVSVTTSKGTTPTTSASQYTFQGNWLSYVADLTGRQVTPINLASNTPLAPIPMQFQPSEVAITPNGQTAYVVNELSDVIIPVDVATNTAKTPIPSLGDFPDAIAITPDGKTAYIANGNTANVLALDIATNTPGVLIPVGTAPVALAITPDGTTVYVVNAVSNNVTPINVATNTPGTPIAVGLQPFAIAVTPDGRTAYIANSEGANVTPITIATNTAGPPIAVGNFPNGLAITPDGQTLFVTNASSNSVTPISIATNTPGPSFSIGNNPIGIAITPDGKTGYVTSYFSDSLIPFDVATHAVGTPIATGGGPNGLAITPDQAPFATFTFNTIEDGLTVIFDASASVSPVGSIVNYAWDFGDGHTESTSNRVISHLYTSTGPFLVTLTVTNSAGTSTRQVFTGQTVSNNGGPNATTSVKLTLLSPPTRLHGKQVANRFLTQTDLVNILTWNPPQTGELPVAYHIYRNSSLTQFVAKVSASKRLTFADHNRKEGKTYSYYIVSIDANGRQSAPTKISIKGS